MGKTVEALSRLPQPVGIQPDLASDTIVQVRNLTFAYSSPNGHQVEVLAGLDFDLAKGHTCALIGPSGCGKTTFLYLLAGLLASTSGEIIVKSPPALILQDYGLLPWKTVWDNAALGLVIRGQGRRQSREQVVPTLKSLGLWERRFHYPAQLSGGQRQRVAIARALALNSELMLMDEPFSSLDALTREELQDTLLGIWRQRRISMVLVTHSIEEAVYLGQKIVVLSPAPARIKGVIFNQGMGGDDYRNQAQFHQRCAEIRQLLQS